MTALGLAEIGGKNGEEEVVCVRVCEEVCVCVCVRARLVKLVSGFLARIAFSDP